MNSNERAVLTHIKFIRRKRVEQMRDKIVTQKKQWTGFERFLWQSQIKDFEQQLYKVERKLFGCSISELTFYIAKGGN